MNGWFIYRTAGKGRLNETAAWRRGRRGACGAGEAVVEHVEVVWVDEFAFGFLVCTVSSPATVAHGAMAEWAVG